MTHGDEFRAMMAVLNNDFEYAWLWHRGLSAMLHSTGVPESLSTERSAGFIKQTFGIDLTDSDRYLDTVEGHGIPDMRDEPVVLAFKAKLQEDFEYAWGWHCNLTMLAADAGATLINANLASALLMKRWFGIDLSTSKRFRDSIVKKVFQK